MSEVGVAVPDVLAAVRELEANGIRSYGGPPGESFAPVGDVNGLLIVVAPGRPWFPSADRIAAPSPAKIHLEGGHLLRF